ncbi:EAL domain-containing protein [Pleurocapsales cyanobacterium LEGE 06147]|nr:EAL domain-containing protein [Pleurocapsales cyanobacterium LEGE 06147]
MPETILVVEDESIIAQDLQTILEDLGYFVPAIADSGELAIQKTAEINPDLILMDIRLLGEMDGIAAAKQISDRFDIPVVYITAHADEVTLRRAKITEPLGYIIKPFEQRELRTTIEIALYKHQMERQLRENAQWLATVLNSISDGVITTDCKACITFINPIAETLTGWSLNNAVGTDAREVFKIINETTRKSVNSPINQVLETGKIGTLPEHTLLVRKDGTEVPIEDSAAPITNYKGTTPIKDSIGSITGTVLIFRDVTQQRLAAQKLHSQAFYDALTNLPNRAWFMERLTDAVERVKRHPDYLFAVLFLDLDRFKVVNDGLGHTVGDRLLVAVAARLLKSVRLIDTVARLGGDEFAILLENLPNEHEAYKVAQRIQQELSISFNLNGQEVFTNASMGIVLSSIGYEQIEELLRDADIAMYRAKAKGRGRYEVFDTVMRSQVLSVLQLENDLRQAFERDELIVYYQPIVSLTTQEIVSFEALVRWHHPQRGLICAAEFIPIAEEIGLIVPIDRWVLREACRQMKAWQEERQISSSSTISVNLSSRDLIQPNLVEQIRQILDETGLEASSLNLEITESAIIENPESAAVLLAELKALGIGLSLDDFGKGYSSLNYLHRFPIDLIKIDRSFISRILESLEIVRAIVTLGNSLGLKIVAEGVETSEQLALLQQLSCQYAQGYLFSPPRQIKF